MINNHVTTKQSTLSEQSDLLAPILQKNTPPMHIDDEGEYEEWFKCTITLADNIEFHASVGYHKSGYPCLLLVQLDVQDNFVYKGNYEGSFFEARMLNLDEFQQMTFYAEKHGMISHVMCDNYIELATKIEEKRRTMDEERKKKH